MAALMKVKNISTGARGAYAEGALVMAEAGDIIEADDFADEWFEIVKAAKPEVKAESKAEAKVEVKK